MSGLEGYEGAVAGVLSSLKIRTWVYVNVCHCSLPSSSCILNLSRALPFRPLPVEHGVTSRRVKRFSGAACRVWCAAQTHHVRSAALFSGRGALCQLVEVKLSPEVCQGLLSGSVLRPEAQAFTFPGGRNPARRAESELPRGARYLWDLGRRQ